MSISEHSFIQHIFSIFQSESVPIRLVGGYVRDQLIGQTTPDIDMCAACAPDILMRILAPHGHVIPTGVRHGTVTYVYKGWRAEITSLRHDTHTYGRYANVAFGASFEDDAQRRDFTFNALSMDASGRIFDYTHGRRDLKKGCVRFIGIPHQRVIEDYLRIVRFFRMSLRFGIGKLHKKSLCACVDHAHDLQALSRERIRQEFLKILSPIPSGRFAHDAHAYRVRQSYIVRIMAKKKILFYAAAHHNASYSLWKRFLNNWNNNCDNDLFFALSLIALYDHSLNIGSKNQHILSSLFVLTRTEKKYIQTFLKWHTEYPCDETHNLIWLNRVVYNLGAQTAASYLALCAAYQNISSAQWMHHIHNVVPKPCPVKAHDIQTLLQASPIKGADIGRLLNHAEFIWCAWNFSGSRAQLLNEVLITQLQI